MSGSTSRPWWSAGNLEELTDHLITRFATPEDAEGICALFKKVFREDMSIEHWRWKYDREHSHAVVVFRDDVLVAHYGGVGIDICYKGADRTAIQITDLMVDPDARQGVRSRSPFNLAAQKFLESLVGFDKPFLLAFGFPSVRAMGLSEKMGYFATAGTMVEIEWCRPESCEKGFSKVVELTSENFAAYASSINRLWSKGKGQLDESIICRKDSAYFKWRYLDHPSKKYSLYLVPGLFRRSAKAIFVMRHDDNKSMLMDLLCTWPVFVKTLSTAGNIALRQGNTSVTTWCADGFKMHFDVMGAKIRDLPITIPACTWTEGPDIEEQKGRWWFMPGDTDYL